MGSVELSNTAVARIAGGKGILRMTAARACKSGGSGKGFVAASSGQPTAIAKDAKAIIRARPTTRCSHTLDSRFEGIQAESAHRVVHSRNGFATWMRNRRCGGHAADTATARPYCSTDHNLACDDDNCCGAVLSRERGCSDTSLTTRACNKHPTCTLGTYAWSILFKLRGYLDDAGTKCKQLHEESCRRDDRSFQVLHAHLRSSS